LFETLYASNYMYFVVYVVSNLFLLNTLSTKINWDVRFFHSKLLMLTK